MAFMAGRLSKSSGRSWRRPVAVAKKQHGQSERRQQQYRGENWRRFIQPEPGLSSSYPFQTKRTRPRRHSTCA